MTPPIQNDSNSLLVPVFLDAFVVDASTQQPMAIYQAAYNNLSNYTDPLPPPIIPGNSIKPAEGIYLHWALPDALTHGGELGQQFPYAPNRWLVVRLTPGNPAGSTMAWVIQSDYTDTSNGTAQYIDPANPPSIDSKGTITVNGTLLGKNYAISAWEAQGDPGTADFFLQAVAPGNISFAAYQPFNPNVFSFTDSSNPANGNYSYMVVGWYSNPAHDPLAGATSANFESILAQLLWSLPAGTQLLSSPPTTSLYHGFVADVAWPSSHVTNPNIPSPANVQVAVGNTAVDALSALIQNQASVQSQSDKSHSAAWLAAGNTLCSLIQAANLQVLDDYGVPGGNTLVQQQIEKSWFGDDPGGTIWTVASVTAQNQSFDITGDGLTPAQNTALLTQLAALNKNQQAYDAGQRKLASLQNQLYITWLDVMQSISIYNKFGENPTTTPDWGILQHILQNNLYPDLFMQVWNLYNEQANLRATLPDPTNPTSATNWADTNWTFPSATGTGNVTLSSLNLLLKGTAAPNFQHPVDPVVLVCGAGMTNKYGRDGVYNADGTLTVRLGAQTITGIAASGEPNVEASNFSASILNPLSAYTQVPAIPNLLTEAFFSDPLCAQTMANTVSGTNATELNTCITNLLNNAATPGGNWVGTPPSPMAYSLWSQAWSPLWMEWMVNYYPTITNDGTANFDMTSWTFDGQHYQWTGNGISGSTPYNLELSGRSVAVPYIQNVLKGALSKYLHNHPAIDSTQLESLLNTVMNWDIMSQSLSGLTSQLLTLNLQTSINPPVSGNPVPNPVPANATAASGPPVGDLIQGQHNYTPILETAETGNIFFPIRGGLVTFAGMQLVDAFGQVCNLGVPNTPNGFQPLLSPSITPPASLVAPTNLNSPFILGPRLAQSARLNMEFMANDLSATLTTATNNNPICGWILPNHLDNSIDVYDGDGNLLGELLPLSTNPLWRPAPGNANAPASPQDISNSTLCSVISQLAVQTTAVFSDFMQVIDETLWMSAPLGGQSDTFMSALMGRPLAVVNMQVGLELNGEPATNQLFNEMLTPGSTASNFTPVQDTGDAETTSFPLTLGSLQLRNDGLMGYFFSAGSDAYNNFYSVHDAPTLSAGDTFVQPILNTQTGTYNGNLNVLADGSTVSVTLLMDPLGAVHGYSGILPVASAALPGYLVQDFLKNLLVNFETGPILADGGNLRTPEPATKQGTWNWLQNVKGTYIQNTIVNANDVARFPLQPPAIREGWLQLTNIDNE
ncbi:MAG: hypothetical protein KBB37_00395 [Bacteroidia bacterium]|nr:hypothetical protein [Bacteroidia bacterium]